MKNINEDAAHSFVYRIPFHYRNTTVDMDIYWLPEMFLGNNKIAWMDKEYGLIISNKSFSQKTVRKRIKALLFEIGAVMLEHKDKTNAAQISMYTKSAITYISYTMKENGKRVVIDKQWDGRPFVVERGDYLENLSSNISIAYAYVTKNDLKRMDKQRTTHEKGSQVLYLKKYFVFEIDAVPIVFLLTHYLDFDKTLMLNIQQVKGEEFIDVLQKKVEHVDNTELILDEIELEFCYKYE